MFFSQRATFLFILSLLVLIPAVVYGLKLTYAVHEVSASPSVQKPVEKKYYAPTHIVISKVGIDLPVAQTTIKDGVWEISEIGASHLKTSSKPGEQGPIIMYGHNTNDRFGPIRWLKVGDTIQIETADKKQHTYVISKTMVRDPNDVHIFADIKKETLVMYTCDGYGDLERFMILAEPAQ